METFHSLDTDASLVSTGLARQPEGITGTFPGNNSNAVFAALRMENKS